jgi:hypothetical protein
MVKLSRLKIIDRGTDYSIAYVSFTGGSGSGASADAVLSGKYGTLRLFYYKPNGEKVIINDNIGTINYLTGKITLGSFKPLYINTNPYYSAGFLTLNIQTDAKTIPPIRNNLLTIDTTDSVSIQITAVRNDQ